MFYCFPPYYPSLLSSKRDETSPKWESLLSDASYWFVQPHGPWIVIGHWNTSVHTPLKISAKATLFGVFPDLPVPGDHHEPLESQHSQAHYGLDPWVQLDCGQDHWACPKYHLIWWWWWNKWDCLYDSFDCFSLSKWLTWMSLALIA